MEGESPPILSMLQLAQIQQVLQVISVDGKLPKSYTHEYYEESKEIKEDIASVFSNNYPEYLNINRPREKKAHKEYRENIYKNPLKGFLDKQIERLDYIPESDDYSVVWHEGRQAELLKEHDKRVFVEKLGFEDWFFDFVKTDFVKDPNAVLVFVPHEIPESDTEPYKPIAELIGSENVFQFRKGKYAVLRSNREVKVINETTKQIESDGLLLYFFDEESYTVVQETARASVGSALKSKFLVWGLSYEVTPNMDVKAEFKPFLHRCKGIPARKIGKKRIKVNGKGEELFASTVTNALEHIKDAQARYSDIQVEFNYHVNSQEYRVATRPCSANDCNKGQVPVRDRDGLIIGSKTCGHCQGTGMEIGGSALDFIVYSMPKKEGFTDEIGNVPAVPGGFIPRPIESVRELVNEYKRKTDEAYADVHMAFHNRTPLVESGTAKEVDREEFYRDCIVLAKHFCGLLQWGYNVQASYMFGLVGLDESQIPKVITPSRFMLSGIDETRTELNEAITNGYETELLGVIQARMLEYQAGKDSLEYKRFVTRQHLDPLRGLKAPEKALQLGVISQMASVGSEAHTAMIKQFVLSFQFQALLDEAEMSYADFYQKTLKERQQILLELSEKYTNAIPKGLELPVFGKGNALEEEEDKQEEDEEDVAA